MSFFPGSKYPRWIVMQLVEKCNLRCRMCYEWGEYGAYHGNQTTGELDFYAVEKLVKESVNEKPYFGLFGGEPFLHPRVIDIIQLITERGCKVDIPTNGTLLEKYKEEIVKSAPTRLWISLDGPRHINDKQRGKAVFQKVVSGIDELYEFRKTSGKKFPKIGITFIVTPYNCHCIEEFFSRTINLGKLDHISIEFQLFATREQHLEYETLLINDFGKSKATCAAGIVQDVTHFADMDFKSITEQMLKVRELCYEKGVYFITYPKTIELENITNFFCGNWDRMKDYHKQCFFPWFYAEISAKGQVTVCHTFYDLPIGSIYEKSLHDIWLDIPIKKVREHVKKQLFPICTACSRFYADPDKR